MQRRSAIRFTALAGAAALALSGCTLAGGAGSQFALGTVSGRPGLYLARRIGPEESFQAFTARTGPESLRHIAEEQPVLKAAA